MHLLNSWRDALLLVHPTMARQLLLITMNAVFRTVPQWVHHFWWLIGLNLLEMYIIRTHRTWPEIIFPLLVITLMLTIRPSVERKTWGYFTRYSYTASLLIVAWYFIPSWEIVQGVLRYFSVWPFLYAFFVFDSPGQMKDLLWSVSRTTKMYLFNMPVLLLIELIFTGFNHVIVWCEKMWPTMMGKSIIFLSLRLPILILLLCLINTIYSKKVREHYALYFPKKG